MSPLRYDDPRVLRAGNEAYGAFVRACGWAEANGLRELPREAARLVAPARVWRRLAEAGLVHALEGGAWGLDGPTRRQEQLEAPPAAEAPRAPLTQAERARRYRERHASTVTPSRDDSHGAVTGSVTGSVTPSRDAASRASLPSPEREDPLVPEMDGISESAREVVTVPVTRDVTQLPRYEDPSPPFVAHVLSTWQMSTGRRLDATETWTRFLAHAHARRERGQVAHATEHEFRMWVAGTKPPSARSGARPLQQDPPGPKAYPVASPDDEWTERRTS